uniref:Phospholipase A2 domain-containing protein n=1 Tax=Oncorhynchus mykiss TaxID=8022 RepID=A0A8C7TIF8_ONCMY
MVFATALEETFKATNLNNRALWQFRDMIPCTMPDSWPILDYTDYRCYCGK